MDGLSCDKYIYDLMLLLRFKDQYRFKPQNLDDRRMKYFIWISVEKTANIIIKNRIVYQEL